MGVTLGDGAEGSRMSRPAPAHPTLPIPAPMLDMSDRIEKQPPPRAGGDPDHTPAPPHLGDAKQGQQEGPEGDAECEELPVSLQDLEVIGQARDDGLHASHLGGTRQGGCRKGGCPAPQVLAPATPLPSGGSCTNCLASPETSASTAASPASHPPQPDSALRNHVGQGDR